MPDPSITAQETYAGMLRDRIAPRLRRLGFRGSGSVFVLPDADAWMLVAFQKDRYSDRHNVRFTVNVTWADKARWAEARTMMSYMGSRPSGTAVYALPDEAFRWDRLGTIMPIHRDVWIQVAAGQDTSGTATDVVAMIETYAVPWLRSRP